MRSNILQKYPTADARVYVIWFNMLTGDSKALIDRKVLNDHRVTNYYDSNRVIGTWFGQQSGDGGVIWDAYFLYGADATWSSDPGTPLSSGGTVIGSSGDLAAAFATLAQSH